MSHFVPTMSTTKDGNTKHLSRVAASSYWTFTLNNFTDEEFKILEIEIKNNCLDYRVQEEIGESGTPHLQGFIHSKKRIRPMETFSNKRIHWEKCRNPSASRSYCAKEDSATGKYILDTEEPLDLIKPDRPWQLGIIEMVKGKASYRDIYWYWEPFGNVGKSAFTKYLCAKHDALCVSGKSNDCKYAIVKYKEIKKVYPKIIIFDIPRTTLDYVNYEAIEVIKNGCFFSGKYESCQVIMNCPHIIIFANRAPERHKMSSDRWNIVMIEQDQSDQRNECNTSIEDLNT